MLSIFNLESYKEHLISYTTSEFEYYEDVDSNLSIGSMFVLSQLLILDNFTSLVKKFKSINELTRTLKK